MRLAVVGCGAVGGVIAACLTRQGNDVTAIVSNPRIETALLRDGFRFSELGAPPISLPLTRPPAKTIHQIEGVFDLVVTATPSTALETALRGIKPLLADDAIVVTCQNGLPENRAIAIVGERGRGMRGWMGCRDERAWCL
jgi:2-dehydropantoate 2-reductase